jgi:hypothetical protein
MDAAHVVAFGRTVVGLTTVETVFAAPSSAVRSRSGFALAPSRLAAILDLSGFKLLLASDTFVIMVLGYVCRRTSPSSSDREAETASPGTLVTSQRANRREAKPSPSI